MAILAVEKHKGEGEKFIQQYFIRGTMRTHLERMMLPSLRSEEDNWHVEIKRSWDR